jgi:Cu(I)/Ag(I) efflux system membrane fusion protein
MHPQIVRDQAGQCPICGMDLVPTAKYGFTDDPIPQQPSLHVPRSAVLMAGESSVVYVETEPGRFEIRPVAVGPILRDKIVILDGLNAGESVATAGNFLIDSQMQLAGKPSLIDVGRAIAKAKPRKGPLQVEVAVQPIAGEAGQTLEQLFASYFTVHQSLASQQVPSEQAAQSLNGAAKRLAAQRSLPPDALKLADVVAEKSAHLHHMDLAAARKAFDPISQAIVKLAAHYRGATATTPFTQFYCPMVSDTGGDWVQPTGELLNPFMPPVMRSCGETVRELPAKPTREATL